METILKISKYLSNTRHTFIKKLFYSSYLTTKGKVIIEKRVNIRPFYNQKRTLKIILNNNTRLKHDIIIQGSGEFVLGENSYISSYSVIGVNEKINIGANVMIANNVSIRDTDHNFSDTQKNIINQGIITSPIVIEDNVWIGHGVVITKGVTIKTGSIIAANAVVTKNVPANVIVGGVPARILKERNGKES